MKFLRPIDVTDASANFTDAAGGGSDAKVFLTLKDWRDVKFADASITKTDFVVDKSGANDLTAAQYFTYYDITAVHLETKEATTNINGTEAKLFTVKPNAKLTYKAASTLSAVDFGTLHYENDNTTTGEYWIKIPATVTYKWGTVKATVVATVKKTMNNAKRR